jgi:hypothetical protein
VAYGALMSFNIKDLRSISDEELIRLHDALAVNTSVGVDYYLEELQRREQRRANEISERLSRRVVVLTLVNTAAVILALGVSVLALLR